MDRPWTLEELELIGWDKKPTVREIFHVGRLAGLREAAEIADAHSAKWKRAADLAVKDCLPEHADTCDTKASAADEMADAFRARISELEKE